MELFVPRLAAVVPSRLLAALTLPCQGPVPRLRGKRSTAGVPRPNAIRPGPVSAALAGLFALAGTGHLLYPAVLYLLTRRLGDEEPPEPMDWPRVVVIVPAYREEQVIGAKVADVMANGYAGPLEVIVVADDAATAEAARETGAKVLTSKSRLGKAEALNRGFAAARGDVIILTDANALLVEGSLAALTRWFRDPDVGAVAGEKEVAGSSGEGAYWRFESWLKRREARLGSTIGLVGELAAIRPSVFRRLPADLAVDDLWLALDVIEGGARVTYEPAARAVEEPCLSWAEEWERRTRVTSGVLDVIWRRRQLLRPSHGVVAAQLWGHRLMRSSIGPLSHLFALLVAASSFRRSRFARVVIYSHVPGLIALLRTRAGARQTAVEGALGQALFLQAVALGGLTRYIRGDRPALWPKGDRRVVSIES